MAPSRRLRQPRKPSAEQWVNLAGFAQGYAIGSASAATGAGWT